MAIALIIPDRKLDALQQALQQALPQVPLQIWPEITAPQDVDFAVVWRQPAGSLQALTNLKALQSFGAGVDNILADPMLPDLPLARIVDPDLTQSMLGYLQTVLQYYQCRFDEFARQQQAGVWKPRSPRRLKHIAVLGLGELGAAAAAHFAAQGFEVSGWSASAKQLPGVTCYAADSGFVSAVADADLVICLLPLTAQTENLLNRQRLALFKPGALLVNVARGAIVVDNDLLAALDSGQLGGACLDVFRTEPLPGDHPFWQQSRILLTPHISAVTNAATAVQQIADNYRRLQAGLPLFNLIDKTRGY